MKTIDYYMSLPYRLEIVPDSAEGGYVAAYPELPGCITVGNTLEETVAHVLDAKREWLTAALEDGIEIKEPVSLDDYSGQLKLRIPKSLHRCGQQNCHRVLSMVCCSGRPQMVHALHRKPNHSRHTKGYQS